MSKQSRTKERRKAREQQRRRNQQMGILAVVVVIAVLAVILVITANQPVSAPTPENVSAQYEGIERSFSEEGFPRLGDPLAPVKVVEYSSFDCPHCLDFHESTFSGLLDRVKAGDILFTYVPLYGTGGVANGEFAARAALCAGAQGKFWEMHDTLFGWQAQFGNNAFVSNRLTSGAANLGLDTSAFGQCLNSQKVTDTLNAAQQSAVSRGSDYTGTPSVFVNGAVVSTPDLSAINAAIDAVMPVATPQPEATSQVEATAEPPTPTAVPPTATATVSPTESTPEATSESSQ